MFVFMVTFFIFGVERRSALVPDRTLANLFWCFGKSGFGARPKRNFVVEIPRKILIFRDDLGRVRRNRAEHGSRLGLYRDSSAFNASLPEAFQIYYFQI